MEQSMNTSQRGISRHNEFDLISAAILAPSSHNTQPWLFRLHDGGFDLLADRTRALPVNDPDDRELTISCGCALFNIRVAAAHAGIGLSISLLPKTDQPELLARVELLGPGASPHEMARLKSVLTLRHTYRQTFAPVEVTSSMLDNLVYAAEYDRAWIKFLTRAEERTQLATLVAEGDSIQWGDVAWREELAEWMRPRKAGDGLHPPGPSLPIGRHIIRRLNIGGPVASRDRLLIEDSPMLAVIGTDGRDDANSWLIAGMALQHVLLAAAFHGLQASYLNQPIQVASLRPRLRKLVATDGSPQIVVRLGMASSTGPRTSRRPVQNVIGHGLEKRIGG